MTRVKIIIHDVPKPWKAAFVSKWGSFSKHTDYLKRVRSLIKEKYDGDLMDCAICMDAYFYFPIPKSFSKKKRKLIADGYLYPTSAPDRTNCLKLQEDILQGVVYKNDAQIVDGRILKLYAHEDCNEGKIMLVVQPAITDISEWKNIEVTP